MFLFFYDADVAVSFRLIQVRVSILSTPVRKQRGSQGKKFHTRASWRPGSVETWPGMGKCPDDTVQICWHSRLNGSTHPSFCRCPLIIRPAMLLRRKVCVAVVIAAILFLMLASQSIQKRHFLPLSITPAISRATPISKEAVEQQISSQGKEKLPNRWANTPSSDQFRGKTTKNTIMMEQFELPHNSFDQESPKKQSIDKSADLHKFFAVVC